MPVLSTSVMTPSSVIVSTPRSLPSLYHHYLWIWTSTKSVVHIVWWNWTIHLVVYSFLIFRLTLNSIPSTTIDHNNYLFGFSASNYSTWWSTTNAWHNTLLTCWRFFFHIYLPRVNLDVYTILSKCTLHYHIKVSTYTEINWQLNKIWMLADSDHFSSCWFCTC